MSDGVFRAPLWVGKEPVGVDFETALADFEGGAAEGVYLTAEQISETQKRPYPIDAGPMEFATTRGLESWPSLCFDVNAYYAQLGVTFRASNTELKRAYQRKQGWKSVRLTYVLKQLLNPAVRRAYDATPLGGIFFDEYFAQKVKDYDLQQSIIKHGRIPTLDERLASNEDLVDLSTLTNKEFDPNRVDKDSADQLTWKWGYYLLQTYIHNTPLLREWQGYLLEAELTTPKPQRLSVGLMSNCAESVRLIQIGFRTVAFIREDIEPNLYLALACLLLVPEQI